MRGFAGLFLATAAAVAATWWWLGRPVALPPAAADPGPIQCMSYAPFRGGQSPLVETTKVEPFEIAEDLAKLARLTGCVRTYSIENGLDAAPEIAARLGLKVLQGLWLGSDRQKNRRMIDGTVALAQRHRDAISAIVVGNEVLLRGELAAEDIAAALREVKAATALPVTYADVWEYWLRNRDLAPAVDFVTIHILPYWEDFPIAAEQAGAHVDAIRARVAATFPGKDIFIGEVGWPSVGRMREGALPSPSNQARVLAEVMARALGGAGAGNYRVNLIEAFDQPWKRQLEGTVGGYWGLLSSRGREAKFAWGQPVSDHPGWPWQLAFGVAMAGAVFAAAGIGRRMTEDGGQTTEDGPPTSASADVGRQTTEDRGRTSGSAFVLSVLRFPSSVVRSPSSGPGLVLIALAAGIAVPWAIANVAIESFGFGGVVREATFAAVAVTAPVTAAMALAAKVAVPPFSRILGPPAEQAPGWIAWACGAVLMAATILALQTALGLVFDPRYRDFAFAQLTAAAVPFAVVAASAGRRKGSPKDAPKSSRSRAETIAAATLAGSALYIIVNESFANWQALWFAAALIVLAVTLARSREGQT
jgi:exo-beta-1,3-glucanase (GH17 family)